MNQLKVREITLQPGRPKVAVPLVSQQPIDLITECEYLKNLPCDMVEWRADYFLSAIDNLEDYLSDSNGYLNIIKILDDINYIAAEKPLILTVRSLAQGGQIQLTRNQLESIYSIASKTGLIDFVDIELYDKNGVLHEEWVREQIDEAHRCGVKVILSHHDFAKMPQPMEMVEIAKTMYRLGADVCKIAAMAFTKDDAMSLMKTTAYLNNNNIGPLIMLAMGEAGMVTRVAGGKYGSTVTFASGRDQSAPGQADTYTMKKWLDSYYGV